MFSNHRGVKFLIKNIKISGKSPIISSKGKDITYVDILLTM